MQFSYFSHFILTQDFNNKDSGWNLTDFLNYAQHSEKYVNSTATLKWLLQFL